MKADWNDAPEHIRTSFRRSNTNAWIIPGIIGTCITLGIMQMAGSAFLKGTVQNLANTPPHSKLVPVAQITPQEQVATKDWQEIVDEQINSDQTALRITTLEQTKTTSIPAKQTVYNDNNYIPRGADNVVSFVEPPRVLEKQKPTEKLKITGIKQQPSMKDRACWPHKEGSIEHRNCRSNVGLNYRD